MKYNNYNAKHFIDKIHEATYIDRAFQRKACWSDEACRSFIRTCSYGRSPTPIVLADILLGKQISEERMDPIGKEKYEKLSEGSRPYKWLSVDGQNRAKALERLFNNTLTLSGTFMDADGKDVYVDNKLFNSLDQRLQDRLKDMDVLVAVYDNCLYRELHENFLELNSSDSLNDQERRNAIPSEISAFIRETAENPYIAPMWTRLFKDEKIARSIDAEWTARAYLTVLVTFGQLTGKSWSSLDKDALDRFYRLGVDKSPGSVVAYNPRARRAFSNILQVVERLSDDSDITQKTWWLCLYVAEEFLYEYDIIDYKKLFKLMRKIDNKLTLAASKQYAKDITKWEDSGQIGKSPAKSAYYFQWRSDPKSLACRNARKEAFFKELFKSSSFSKLVQKKSEDVAA